MNDNAKWQLGTVVQAPTPEKPCSYIVQAENGKSYQRNQKHIKPAPTDQTTSVHPMLPLDSVPSSIACERPRRDVKPPQRLGYT